MTTSDLIRKRRSVRTFNGTPLAAETAENLLDFAEKLENPFERAIEWKILDAQKDGLSSPVITGTNTYIAGKMNRAPRAEEAFGYTFEKVVLYALSLGVGTTWIAGTMDRKAFEHAMRVGEGEVMPCVSPLGYPAKKMSLRETMMRKGIKADTRLPFGELFFDGAFGVPLTEKAAGGMLPLLEAVQLGPSAVNRQPWRVVKCGDTAHFYENSGKGVKTEALDMKKIDLGIALCHFELAAAEQGLKTRFVFEDPRLKNAGDCVYIASVALDTAGDVC